MNASGDLGTGIGTSNRGQWMGLIVALTLVVVSGCQVMSSGAVATAVPPSPAAVSVLATSTPAGRAVPPTEPPKPTATLEQPTPTATLPRPTPTPLPTASPTAAPRGGGGGTACFTPGAVRSEMYCLTDRGWQTFNKSDARFLSQLVMGMDSCPDGSLVAFTIDTLARFDGTQWSVLDQGDFNSKYAMACAPDGRIWLGGEDGKVSVYAGGQWTEYANDLLDNVRRLMFAPDGKVWVARGEKPPVVFDGKTWSVVPVAQPFRTPGSTNNPNAILYSLASTREGKIYALDPQELAVYDGSQFVRMDLELSGPMYQLLVDRQDRVWAGGSKGLYAIQNGRATHYVQGEGQLPSNRVTALQQDTHDRLWVGTQWGLAVRDGETWTSLHISNSGLPFDELRMIAVGGAGPSLPPLVEKPKGQIIGRLLGAGGVPVANTAVEVCVLPLGDFNTANTPCSGSDEPFMAQAQTDANGRFSFSGLPSSHYTLVAYKGDAKYKWSYPTTKRKDLASSWFLLKPGETVDLGDMNL